MEVKYATAQLSDITRIVELKFDMFREFDYLHNLDGQARTIITEDYHRLYDAGLAVHFLAKVDGLIVGVVGAFIKSDIPYRYFTKHEYGFIGDVYTVTEYRNMGVSRTLNKHALAWLKQYGVNTVRLLASNAGRPLYEDLGFSADVGMVLNLDESSQKS